MKFNVSKTMAIPCPVDAVDSANTRNVDQTFDGTFLKSSNEMLCYIVYSVHSVQRVALHAILTLLLTIFS